MNLSEVKSIQTIMAHHNTRCPALIAAIVGALTGKIMEIDQVLFGKGRFFFTIEWCITLCL